jgi:hypothetical protein
MKELAARKGFPQQSKLRGGTLLHWHTYIEQTGMRATTACGRTGRISDRMLGARGVCPRCVAVIRAEEAA